MAKVVLAEEEQFARVMDAGDRDSLTPCMRRRDKDGASQLRFEIDRFEHEAGVDLSKAHADTIGTASLVPLLSAIDNSGLPQHQIFRSKAALEALGVLPLISGRVGFHLYETFGLPLRFHRGRRQRRKHRNSTMRRFRSRQGRRASNALGLLGRVGRRSRHRRRFGSCRRPSLKGYTALRVDGARVLALVKDGVGVLGAGPRRDKAKPS